MFNTEKTWHFQLDGRPPVAGSDFVSIALHEMGHLLGIGTSPSWNALIDGSGLFQGVRSVESFGGPVPVDGGGGHWQDDAACVSGSGYDPNNPLNVLSLTYTSFGTEHGSHQIALMDPASCTITNSTTLKVFTDLDWAALSDIGWEVFQPVSLAGPIVEPADVALNWPSTTGQTYTLQRGPDFDTDWGDLTLAVSGDGGLMTFSDTTAPADKAFYRLVSESAAAAPEVLAFSEVFVGEAVIEVFSAVPPMVVGCGAHEH